MHPCEPQLWRLRKRHEGGAEHLDMTRTNHVLLCFLRYMSKFASISPKLYIMSFESASHYKPEQQADGKLCMLTICVAMFNVLLQIPRRFRESNFCKRSLPENQNCGRENMEKDFARVIPLDSWSSWWWWWWRWWRRQGWVWWWSVGSWPAQVLALLRRQQSLPSDRHQIHLLCFGIVDS